MDPQGIHQGFIMDSSRFIYFLSEELKVSVQKIKSFVLGGHGDSMVAMLGLTEVDGKKINDSSQLKNIISTGRPNDNTQLTIIRGGKKKSVIVKLGTRPGQNELAEVYQYGNTSNFDLLGLIVKNNRNNETN